MKKANVKNMIWTVVFVIFLAALIVTLSIGVPIYCRFFYYIQIKTLHMEANTGWSYDTIKEAYDDVLNFLTLPNHPFGTGELLWTESEMEHFADCKYLFNINLFVMIVSFVIVVTCDILNKLKAITLSRVKGHSVTLVAAFLPIAIVIVIGVCIVCVGFDEAFEVFHAIFFPGKENWTFNPKTEQIINVMPEEFFLNCAILIGVAMVLFAVIFVIYDVVSYNKRKKKLRSGV